MSIDADIAAHSEPVTDFELAQASAPFHRLKRRHRIFVFPLAVVFVLWYFAYLLLSDYAHEFMSTRVIGTINIGLLLWLAQFVTTLVITTCYVSRATRKLHPLANEIRNDDLASSAHANSVRTHSANTDSGAHR